MVCIYRDQYILIYHEDICNKINNLDDGNFTLLVTTSDIQGNFFSQC